MKPNHTKIDRSGAKWLPGAMALAATTASSQAATVQITLDGNKISYLGGNQLVADLTGDGVDDLNLSGASIEGAGLESASVFVSFPGGQFLRAYVSAGNAAKVDASFAGSGVGTASNSGKTNVPVVATYLNPITFQDTRINGGSVTSAWLETTAGRDAGGADTYVLFSRLIFDDESTTRPAYTSIPGVEDEWQVSAVPEPGQNLALLALGAGGLLMRRRAKRAA